MFILSWHRNNGVQETMKLKLWRDPKLGKVYFQYFHRQAAWSWVPWIQFKKGGSASYFAFGPRIKDTDGWNRIL